MLTRSPFTARHRGMLLRFKLGMKMGCRSQAAVAAGITFSLTSTRKLTYNGSRSSNSISISKLLLFSQSEAGLFTSGELSHTHDGGIAHTHTLLTYSWQPAQLGQRRPAPASRPRGTSHLQHRRRQSESKSE